jgi:hypothetical protein
MMTKKNFLKTAKRNPGDRKEFIVEEKLEDIKFNIYKLNNRLKPNDPRQVLMICCFSEFGCETVGALYCIPRIMKDHPNKYKIIVGWHGREYFYRHLADEFWEIKQDHMWLREFSRAFHHESKNLERIESVLKDYGTVVPSSYLGRIATHAKCFDCRLFYNTFYKNSQPLTSNQYDKDTCPKCKSKNILKSIFEDVAYWKPRAIRTPEPSFLKQEEVKKHLGQNPVAIFARGRKCYGRNLQPEFYIELIKLLRSKNYDPIWMGEKVSTLPCPVDDVIDFSRMQESQDLESTFAIIKQCKFTIQFWTASSRLAGIMGTPYLLFESPDQIWGTGQEGIRRNLCDFGHRKLSINHYLNVYQDNEKGIEVVKKNIEEMELGNWEDHIGLVEEKIVHKMKKENIKRIGDLC